MMRFLLGSFRDTMIAEIKQCALYSKFTSCGRKVESKSAEKIVTGPSHVGYFTVV